jgi:site-specific DNA-cytosine methylase
VSGLKNAQVIGAVDINPQANLVYKHNFKETNLIQKTIDVRIKI